MVNVDNRAVLLLNASYTPIRIVSIRRAVNLLIGGVAEAVEGVAARLRTPSTIFIVPSVIRLRYYVNVPKRNAKWSKSGVLRRDNYSCIYCGVVLGETVSGRKLVRDDFTLDHLIPVSQGGKSTWSNTACACDKCNRRKGNRTPAQAGLRLLWEPKLPRTNYLVASGSIPTEWRIYLEVKDT